MLSVLSTAVVLASLATAQTYTSCNPLNTTCPADPALGTSVNIDFTQGASSQFSALPGTTMKYGSNGAEFTINTAADAPTMESNWYIFFGKVDVVMQASPGVGVVSSIVLESDDLDEVDWEWLGGDTTQVQTDYFGKGDTGSYNRGGFGAVASPQTSFHKYSLDWTKESIVWSIDDVVIRTLLYADAEGGSRFPQTPCRIKLGSWDAGNPNEPVGTQQWAGGDTDFSQAPFTMYVKSISVTDGTTGAAEYVYGDMSGSWQSIKTEGSSSGKLPSDGTTSLVQVTSSAPSVAVPTTVASTSAFVAATTTSAVSTVSTQTTLVTVSTQSSSIHLTHLPVSVVSSTSAAVQAASTTTTTTSATATPVHNAAGKHGVAKAAVAGLGLVLGYMMM